MKPLARRMVETLVLAATSVCLIGHGVGQVPPCYDHSGETRSYNVVGTCGPAGVVTVSWSRSNFCALELTGDNVGLPSSGTVEDRLDSGFYLTGAINSDWDQYCTISPPSVTDAGPPPAGVSAAGTLAAACRRHPSASNPYVYTTDPPWCQATLEPVTTGCNLKTCPAVACSSQEHTAFATSGCCPVCVANGPNDAVPTTPPVVCHPETCPQGCPAGQEMFTSDNACCGTCQAPSQECLDGRAQWQSEVTTRWLAARICTIDADCTITAIGSSCETTCIDAIAIDQIATVSLWAGDLGSRLCASCNTQGAGCANNPSVRPVCNSGICVMIVL
jgi:hypothetical protein